MARITVEDCLKQIPNRYEMVKLAAKRVKQLAVDGREPTVDPEDDKPTVIAVSYTHLTLPTKRIV